MLNKIFMKNISTDHNIQNPYPHTIGNDNSSKVILYELWHSCFAVLLELQ